MIASVGVVFKVCLQEIGEEKYFQYHKHHEKFDQNNKPHLLSPFGHIGESLSVKPIDLLK